MTQQLGPGIDQFVADLLAERGLRRHLHLDAAGNVAIGVAEIVSGPLDALEWKFYVDGRRALPLEVAADFARVELAGQAPPPGPYRPPEFFLAEPGRPRLVIEPAEAISRCKARTAMICDSIAAVLPGFWSCSSGPKRALVQLAYPTNGITAWPGILGHARANDWAACGQLCASLSHDWIARRFAEGAL